MIARAAAVLLLVGGALSRPALADPAYDRCIGQSDNNAAWGDCGNAWITREDARLNAAWSRVYPLVVGEAAKSLLKEQRAWIVYKDASCEWYATGDYGREGQVVDYPMCRAEVIAARTRELDGMQMFLKQGR